MIIINNPHNPPEDADTSDFEALESLLQKYIRKSDEVYGISLLKKKHISAHTRITKPLRNGFLGKSFHVTGWKVGVAPEYLMKEIKKYISFWFSCVSPAR
jgi:aspartate/methionine/tyrosine aminotransferase